LPELRGDRMSQNDVEILVKYYKIAERENQEKVEKIEKLRKELNEKNND